MNTNIEVIAHPYNNRNGLFLTTMEKLVHGTYIYYKTIEWLNHEFKGVNYLVYGQELTNLGDCVRTLMDIFINTKSRGIMIRGGNLGLIFASSGKPKIYQPFLYTSAQHIIDPHIPVAQIIDSSIIKNEYEKIIRNDKNTNLAESLITIAKIFDKYHQS